MLQQILSAVLVFSNSPTFFVSDLDISVSDMAPARRSSRARGSGKKITSDARTHGFQMSSRSTTSSVAYPDLYPPKRRRDDETIERPIKHRSIDEDHPPNGASSHGAPKDAPKQPRGMNALSLEPVQSLGPILGNLRIPQASTHNEDHQTPASYGMLKESLEHTREVTAFPEKSLQDVNPGQKESERQQSNNSLLGMNNVSQAASREDSPDALALENHCSSAPSQGDPLLPQTPTLNETYQTPASSTNEHSWDESLEAMEARYTKDFEEKERVRQKRREEELAEKKRQQRSEYEHELRERFKKKERDAETSWRARIEEMEGQHQKRMAEMQGRI